MRLSRSGGAAGRSTDRHLRRRGGARVRRCCCSVPRSTWPARRSTRPSRGSTSRSSGGWSTCRRRRCTRCTSRPEVVYTYPFPGTHYLLALMSRAGDIDPFFLYYKTRAIWGMAASTLLYGCVPRAVRQHSARARERRSWRSGWWPTARSAAVPDFSWAQLAPLQSRVRHRDGRAAAGAAAAVVRSVCSASRAARALLLPGRARLALASMLVMVHPREIVQFLVYLTAFAAMARLGAGIARAVASRAGVLVVATLAVLVVYRVWHQSVVPGRGRAGRVGAFRPD